MLLDKDDQRKARFLASMSVQVRQAQGKDAETIRKEVATFAAKQIREDIDDPIEQESWLIEIAKAVDAELAKSA